MSGGIEAAAVDKLPATTEGNAPVTDVPTTLLRREATRRLAQHRALMAYDEDAPTGDEETLDFAEDYVRERVSDLLMTLRRLNTKLDSLALDQIINKEAGRLGIDVLPNGWFTTTKEQA